MHTPAELLHPAEPPHPVSLFALFPPRPQLLLSSLRRGALAGRSPATLGLLDPMLPVLVRALRCRHGGSVTLALRALSHLVTLPLPGVGGACAPAGKAVTVLLKRAPSAAHPLAQECFRLLAGMLRECASYQPTTAQVRLVFKLLQLVRNPWNLLWGSKQLHTGHQGMSYQRVHVRQAKRKWQRPKPRN